jgi:hypothetical protein
MHEDGPSRSIVEPHLVRESSSPAAIEGCRFDVQTPFTYQGYYKNVRFVSYAGVVP